MNWGSIAFYAAGILLFAIAFCVIYIIGLKKKEGQAERLNNMLLNNAAIKVKKYLKEHEIITESGIALVAKETKAREFGSKHTAIVRDGKEFSNGLIRYMLNRDIIEECGMEKGQKTYRLSK